MDVRDRWPATLEEICERLDRTANSFSKSIDELKGLVLILIVIQLVVMGWLIW